MAPRRTQRSVHVNSVAVYIMAVVKIGIFLLAFVVL